jgi:DNA-binding NarL/FixJ family response regulator
MFSPAEWLLIAPRTLFHASIHSRIHLMAKHMLLVDNHEIVRLGLEQIIGGSEIEITQVASDTKEAWEKFEGGVFDLLLVDDRIPGGDCFQFVAEVKQRSSQQNILLFSCVDNPSCVPKAISLRVNGLISKSAPPDKMLDAIRRVSHGESIWTKEELKKASNGVSGIETVSGIPLTLREGEVLQRLANGLTNKEIALSLGISYETVKEHVQHILRKVGVSDRTQAAVWAVRNHLV